MEAQQVTRFTSLWTQTQSSVLAFVCASVRNFADAEDILQRVAAVAVSKFDEFDEAGDSAAFTGWSIRIARFEVLHFLRDRSTDRHTYLAEPLDDIAAAFEHLAPEIDDRRRALAHCVTKLKGRSREVLAKRYGEGLKTGKIAQSMDLTPGNVSVILNRAYQSLRRCIDQQLGTESS
ncbi:MAG: sigma-70 family RNA polymerase sigma factor [Planctomycetota bacterium]